MGINQQLALKLIVPSVAVLLSVAASEGVLRWLDIPKVRSSVTLTQADLLKNDPTLGWSLNDLLETRREKNRCNEEVTQTPPASSHLNKAPAYDSGPVVVFLGDSITHAYTVNKGKAFYDYFEAHLPYRSRVYAAGVGGYGTAQEFLLLQSLKTLHPDVVVWQFGTNDLINNVFDFERADPANNNGLPRPYYDPMRDSFEIRNPAITVRSYYLGKLENSKLAQATLMGLIKLDAVLGLQLFELRFDKIRIDTPQRVAYGERGDAIIRSLLQKARREFPGTQFLAFNSCGTPAFSARIRDLIGKDFFIDEIDRLAADTKMSCPGDAHWNHSGHERAGQAILNKFVELHPRGFPR